MFQRIVVPLDGSPRAEQALPVAARLARMSKGSVLLMRVCTTSVDLAWSAMESTLALEDSVQAERTNATEYLAHVAASNVLAGVVTIPLVLEGPAAQGILNGVIDQAADSIVMCSHGDTGLKRWLYGSVAQKVAHHSSVPVLILREGRSIVKAHPDEKRPVRVLVPLDGSPLAEQAVVPAALLSAALSDSLPAELHLIQILPYIQAGRVMALGGKGNETAEAEAYLKGVEERLCEGELTKLPVPVRIFPFVAVASDIAGMIIDAAEGKAQIAQDQYIEACDSIAMATHWRSGFSHWLLGSVTERVLSTSTLPLFILRTPAVTPKSAHPQKETQTAHRKDETSFTSWVGLL